MFFYFHVCLGFYWLREYHKRILRNTRAVEGTPILVQIGAAKFSLVGISYLPSVSCRACCEVFEGGRRLDAGRLRVTVRRRAFLCSFFEPPRGPKQHQNVTVGYGFLHARQISYGRWRMDNSKDHVYVVHVYV